MSTMNELDITAAGFNADVPVAQIMSWLVKVNTSAGDEIDVDVTVYAYADEQSKSV